jgi:hypothetical protein
MEKERKELANASNSHREALRNQIPKYLQELGVVLSTEKDGLIDHHLLARDHGIHRWTVGWVLSEVAADYQLLQITILEHLAKAVKRSLTIEEMKTFGAFIDEAIMVAVTAFTAESESELRSLNETLEERVIERTIFAGERDTVTRMLGNASRVSKNLALELRPPLDPKNVIKLLEWL